MAIQSSDSPQRKTAQNIPTIALWAEKFLLIGMILVGIVYLLGIHSRIGLVVYPGQYYGLFMGFVISAIFLTKPITGNRRRNLPWYDIIFSILGFAVGLYVAINWGKFLNVVNPMAPERWIPGLIAIPLCIEAVRRTLGLPFTIIIIIVVLFARFGYSLLPSIYFGPRTTWQSLGEYLFWDPSALFGLITGVIATMVLGFIVFGSILMATGGGPALIDFTMSAFGRYTGGPAKVAIVGSGLFGTVSGSVAANLVMVGTLTIPLMKSYGFKADMAGAVESCASTGGQLMPPVMGAAAFIMAEFLGISYAEVAIAAFIPAVLYYLCLFIQVHLEASKLGLKGLSLENIPKFLPSLKRMWLVALPLAVMFIVLFIWRWDAGKSALVSGLALLATSYFSKKSRLSFSKLVNAIIDAGRSMLPVGAVAAGAGIVVGSFNLSASGFALTNAFTRLGGSSVLAVLVLTAVVAIILGMGLPTTAIYVMVSLLLAPTLVGLGISPMAAHLFVFYYALMACITLPVATAVFIAAPMSGASIMSVGWKAMRLGTLGFIVPFIFVFSPPLLLKGSLIPIAAELAAAVIGTFVVAISINGFLLKPIQWLRRTLLGVAGVVVLLPPELGSFWLAVKIAGLVLSVLLLSPELLVILRNRRKLATQNKAS